MLAAAVCVLVVGTRKVGNVTFPLCLHGLSLSTHPLSGQNHRRLGRGSYIVSAFPKHVSTLHGWLPRLLVLRDST